MGTGKREPVRHVPELAPGVPRHLEEDLDDRRRMDGFGHGRNSFVDPERLDHLQRFIGDQANVSAIACVSIGTGGTKISVCPGPLEGALLSQHTLHSVSYTHLTLPTKRIV